MDCVGRSCASLAAGREDDDDDGELSGRAVRRGVGVMLKRSGFALRARRRDRGRLRRNGPATSSRSAGPRRPPVLRRRTAVGTIFRLDPGARRAGRARRRHRKGRRRLQVHRRPALAAGRHALVQRRPGNVVRSVTPDGKVTVLIENAAGMSTAPPGVVHRAQRHGRGAGRIGVDGAARQPPHRARRA